MSLNKKIAHNTMVHLAGKIVGLLIGLSSIVILTRYLGTVGFGYYSTVVAYLMFWGILIDFGLTLTTVQMISNKRFEFQRTINNIMSLRFVLSTAFLVLAPIVIWAFPYPIEIKIGAGLAVFAYFGVTIVQTLTGVFQKELQMWKVTVSEVAGKIAMIGLVGLFAYQGRSIYYLFGALGVEGLVAMIVLVAFSTKFIKWKFLMEKEILKEVFKRCWPIALSISFNLIYLKMDTLILSLTRSQAEVGLYGATYRIIDVLTMLPAVFMGVILPLITVYYVEKKSVELKALLQKAFDVLVIFILPTVVGAFLVGNKLMVLIAGEDFVVSGNILKVLIFASAFIFVTSLFGYAVVGINKQRQMLWGYLTAAVITFIGYLIFIPKFGYWGAAGMTVFSEVIIMVWTWIIVYRTVKFSPKLKTFFISIPATIVMGVVVHLVSDLPVLLTILIAGVVYLLVLALFGGIKLQVLSEVVRLKRK